MSAYYWATPEQLCPCGENPDHSCQRQGNEVRTNVMPSPQEKVLKPGTMRNWFVGFLFAVGALLFINQGHSAKEDWALNLAGLLAIGIAMFPMPWDCHRHPFSPHGFCAVTFFFCIAFVSAVCSRDTLVLIKDPKVRAKYQKAYVGLAIFMVVSPIAAYIFNFVHRSIAWCIGLSCSASTPSLCIGALRQKRCLDPTYRGCWRKSMTKWQSRSPLDRKHGH